MNWGHEAELSWVGATPTMPELRIWGLVRYLVFASLLVASLMFYVWSRVDVRASAATLDIATIQYSELVADQERLQLELAARRDLAFVNEIGGTMGLVHGVDVIDLGVGSAN